MIIRKTNSLLILSGLMTVLILLSSCKKDVTVLDTIPPWLKQTIARDMTIIRQSPHLVNNFGAWYRYLYLGKQYFQYENLLSSASLQIFDYSGNRINVFEEPYENFLAFRCCRKLIWKAPGYVDIGL